MSKIIKVISNELIKIEEYKNPKICFNNSEYDDIENYCILRETINPFHMFYENIRLQQENQQLKEEINKISKKEVKVRNMLYSIENGTLTKERLIQIEEVLFELEENNE